MLTPNRDAQRGSGGRSFTIVWPEGAVHEAADAFLRSHDGSGTQRTYAYLLVDHLRWLEREALALEGAALRDLQRYMGLLGAKVPGPHGEPWRAGGRPYGRSALQTAAACLKGFYLHQASLGVNRELGDQLARTRLPTQADRRRAFLGHVSRELPANPLAPPPARRPASSRLAAWPWCPAWWHAAWPPAPCPGPQRSPQRSWRTAR